MKEQNETCDIVTLIGVVDALGVSAIQWQGEPLKSVSFSLVRWKLSIGGIKRDTLVLSKKVTDAQLQSLFQAIRPHAVIRVEAEGLTNPKKWSGTLVSVIDPNDPDPKLNAYAAKLKKPKTLKDEQFGTLILNRMDNSYSAQTKWNDHPVSVSLSAKRDTDVSQSLTNAQKLWSQSRIWEKRAFDYAVQELLGLKNESWLEEGESPITTKEFLQRLRLESIRVFPDGRFEFWFDDGDLFWGHSVLVEGDLEKGIFDAGILG